MNFLIDAQLPRRAAWWIREQGHDVVHTLDLPEGNRTTDDAIIDIADAENRIVVTKDADFVNSFQLHGRPRKLLLVATGNIGNAQLEHLLLRNLAAIANAFESASFIEFTRAEVIVRA